MRFNNTFATVGINFLFVSYKLLSFVKVLTSLWCTRTKEATPLHIVMNLRYVSGFIHLGKNIPNVYFINRDFSHHNVAFL